MLGDQQELFLKHLYQRLREEPLRAGNPDDMALYVPIYQSAEGDGVWILAPLLHHHTPLFDFLLNHPDRSELRPRRSRLGRIAMAKRLALVRAICTTALLPLFLTVRRQEPVSSEATDFLKLTASHAYWQVRFGGVGSDLRLSSDLFQYYTDCPILWSAQESA